MRISSSLFVSVTLALLVSCTSYIHRRSILIPPEVFNQPPPAGAKRLWNQAMLAYRHGDLVTAVDTWLRIANAFPTNAIAPQSLYQVGRTYMQQGHPDTALEYFEKILARFPQWKEITAVRFERAKILWVKGHHNRAVKEAEKLTESSNVKPELLAQIWAFLAKAYAREKRWKSSLLALEKGLKVTQSRSHAIAKTAQEIFGELDEETSKSLLNLSSNEVRPFLELRLAEIELKKGQISPARAKIVDLMTHYPDHPVIPGIYKILERYNVVEEVNKDRIGCLLPLSGRYSIYAHRVFRGLSLALEDWNQAHPSDPITLIVKDTSSEPKQAIKAFESLVKDYHVAAILGPLSPKCTEAIASVDHDIPVLSLSQRCSSSKDSSPIFYMLPSDRELVEALVRYCLTQLGYKRFATLYPDNCYGENLAKAFAQAVSILGGRLVASSSYLQNAIDFRRYILKLGEKERENPYRLDPVSPIEAIFIPDQIQTVALIAPQLLYHNVVGVTLLGTDLWSDPLLLELGEPYIENAIFVTPYPITDGPPRVKRFKRIFQDRFGKSPTYLEAQAYDALDILLRARSHLPRKIFNSLTLLESLLKTTYSGTLTSINSISPDGSTRRDYFIYQVRNGEPIQLAP